MPFALSWDMEQADDIDIMSRERLAYIFSGIVLTAWMVVLGVGLATRDYTGLTVITPLLMMVGGYLLGYGPKNGGPHA